MHARLGCNHVRAKRETVSTLVQCVFRLKMTERPLAELTDISSSTGLFTTFVQYTDICLLFIVTFQWLIIQYNGNQPITI